jgi:uncharacterized protein (TIGR00661 family)
MRLLYGVVGEGMGHAIRSRVVLEHLLGEKHEVEVMASGRAVDFLSKHFAGVNRIHGLHMVSDENRVRRGKTLWSNVVQSAAGLPQNIGAYFELIERFSPEAVISDFESWTHLYAKTHGLPIFSVDNMQIINRCKHGKRVLDGETTNYRIARTFVKSKLPFCDHYFITTFFFPKLRKKRTSLHPPILRPEILRAPRSDGEHLLVYQTVEGHGRLAEVLQSAGVECRVYGMRRGIAAEQVEGNLRYRPFSEAGFVEDLASCRAVVAGGGFTLMGEAVYLHKPMLSVPLENQFEQTLNARYLEEEGYGVCAGEIDEDVLGGFLRRVDKYRRALSKYSQDDNRQILGALDEHLDRAAAGLY